MKTRNRTLLLSASALAMAFTLPRAYSWMAPPTGTYGVCGCDPTTNMARIALDLNKDNTFHYVDGDTDVIGTWELEGRTISLRPASNSSEVFRKWTMDKDDPCLRSRHGLTFTRLCHLEKCN